MKNNTVLSECVAYFTSTPILKKVLDHCLEKYRSFGYSCGTVVLRGLKPDGIEILEGFTGRNYHGQKSVSLSVSVIQKAMDGSRFAGISLDELLEAYYHGTLKSKKQEAIEEKNDISDFYRRLVKEYADSKAGEWLKGVIEENSFIYRMLQKKYRDKVLTQKLKPELNVAESHLWKEINIWVRTLNSLPCLYGKFEYLPAFAAGVSGDPHYYDEGREYTLLLYYALNDMLHLNRKISSSMPAEDKHDILFKAGLIRDDMSNDALVYGIRGWKEEGEHQGIAGFYNQKEPISITLSTIIGLKCAQGINNCIYVVENPIVFAKVIESRDKSALCVNGQPNLAVLLLMDLLTKNGETIFYNGDFDPEGLLIAQRLKNRYKEALRFWHYEEEDFKKTLSNNAVSDKRLKMLDGLSSPELVKIGEQIRKYRRSGYQERIFFE